MAEKRMFSLKVIDTDAFLDMPLSTQALYFHLSMRADDDGFVANPNKIMRMTNSSKNDFDLLILKRYLIPFESGICVIKHWRMNNYLRSDRYTETTYLEEKNTLECKKNGVYTEKNKVGIPKVSIDKSSIDKSSIDKSSIDMHEQQDCSLPKENIFITLSLNDNSEFEVSENFLNELKPLYPIVDVEQEFRNMKGWLIGNPKKRKTRTGIKRFITTWLSNKQNNPQFNNNYTNGNNKPNDFEQRKNQFADIIRKNRERVE